MCAKPGPQNYAFLRKRAVTNKGIRRVRYALQSTLKHSPHAKYNSTFYVRLVATKLWGIVGSYRNSIIPTKIVICMGVTAYSDVRRRDFEANLPSSFQNDRLFLTKCPICQREVHEDWSV